MFTRRVSLRSLSSIRPSTATLPSASSSSALRSLPSASRSLSSLASSSSSSSSNRISSRRSFQRRAASEAAAVRIGSAGQVLEEGEGLEEAKEEVVWPVRDLPPMSAADIKFSSRQRNVGISAHIDSGKTTLTERVLFYTGRIRDIHEVRGRDSVGAKMDSMDLEREKGITIQSAATFCDWDAVPPEHVGAEGKIGTSRENFNINIIDTPGHVDFTIEVERALRVLDGAVLVLCAVSGVQSQTITVDRQMKRYDVPRISFINKMDRQGADPWRVIGQIRHKLRKPAAAVQIPIGQYDEFKGVVDLIRMKAYYYEGVKGLTVREEEIPAELVDFAEEKKAELIEQLAEVDEAMSDLFLDEQPISPSTIAETIRRCTINNSFTPVMLGSAIKNTGVQALLDGIIAYLPNPAEVEAVAADATLPAAAPPVKLVPAADAPLMGLAFKLEEGKFGQLTYMRIYQGTLTRGMHIYNARTGKKVKVPRLVRMHSAEMEEVQSVGSGEICAMFGVDCSSGDSFTDGKDTLTMTSMFVPEPVVSLALVPEGKESPNFGKGLNRFTKEDPTFRVHLDAESKETIISGMGELHLEIYVERLRREYGVECSTGKPRVAFRETITQPTKFEYIHKKQTGGSGQFGKVMGYIEPMEPNEDGVDVEFESRIMAGTIPNAYIPAIEKGFRTALQKGPLYGSPITGIRYVLEDGAFHAVDSSELAFVTAAIGSIREAFAKAKPVILEPIMAVEVIAPTEFQGNVIGNLNSRRGTINDTETRDEEFTALVDVSLNDMFGYSAALRGMTQGKGEFSMEYKHHAVVMPTVQKTMEAEWQQEIVAKRNAKASATKK